MNVRWNIFYWLEDRLAEECSLSVQKFPFRALTPNILILSIFDEFQEECTAYLFRLCYAHSSVSVRFFPFSRLTPYPVAIPESPKPMYKSIDLDAQRKLHADSPSKTPFPHQTEAFAALNQVFRLGKNKSASGMLVLPTGAGKTFTAVRWLCNHVLPKKIKVLWLAPSYYLLDQAAATFKENVREIPDRKTVNIRCVSSSKSHAKASSIDLLGNKD